MDKFTNPGIVHNGISSSERINIYRELMTLLKDCKSMDDMQKQKLITKANKILDDIERPVSAKKKQINPNKNVSKSEDNTLENIIKRLSTRIDEEISSFQSK